MRIALESLHTVEHLYVSGGGILTYQLLEGVRWPLRCAEVVHNEDDTGMNPIDLIRPMICPTLSELILENWRFHEPSSPFPVFPQLRKLVMTGRKCPIASWVKTFPRIKELVDRRGIWQIPLTRPHVLPNNLEAHNRGVHDYNSEQNGFLGSRFWPSLDVCFVQDLLRMYVLALPCPVRTLVLNDMGNPWSTLMFNDVMKHACPKDLKLRRAYPERLNELLLAIRECAGTSLRGLRRLSMYVVRSGSHTGRMTDIFETLVRRSPTSLSFLPTQGHGVSQQGGVMLGLRCLRALEFCVFYIETSLLAQGNENLVRSTSWENSEDGTANEGDEDTASICSSTSDTTTAGNILDTALPSREPQISSFYAASFDRLSTLRYLVIMGGSVMYGMRRGGILARKPLLDHGSRWFPDI